MPVCPSPNTFACPPPLQNWILFCCHSGEVNNICTALISNSSQPLSSLSLPLYLFPSLSVFVQIFDTEAKDQEREVCFVDIAYDEIPERYYKESEVRACDHTSSKCTKEFPSKRALQLWGKTLQREHPVLSIQLSKYFQLQLASCSAPQLSDILTSFFLLFFFYRFVSAAAAGPALLPLREDVAGRAAGGLAGLHRANHVLLQAGHRQVRGVGAADPCGAVCAQGQHLLAKLSSGF